jgi:hypothetical protein
MMNFMVLETIEWNESEMNDRAATTTLAIQWDTKNTIFVFVFTQNPTLATRKKSIYNWAERSHKKL